jgi:dienelactone hydrolase
MRITELSTWILAGMLSIGVCGVLAAQSAGTGAAPAAAGCGVSQPTGTKVSGTGSHEVIVEYNCSPGISTGTIFRPADMKGKEKYPIFVWGEGGCSQNGMSNAAAMAEIASHGYFVIADGTPTPAGRGANIPMGNGDMTPMGKPLIGYIDWAIAENAKPTSAYSNSLDTKKIASNGFSCGGLMAIGTVGDPRITAWGVTSSGMKRVNDDFYKRVHTPVLFVEGGSGDVAYEGGQMGFAAISKLGVPVLWFSKDIGHGGDLSKPNGGDFGKINLAWLNWQLKGDESATGKGMLIGPNCPYCRDSAWDVKSANVK